MLKKLIKDNSIYHTDDGTSGYSLSDEQVDRIYEAVIQKVKSIIPKAIYVNSLRKYNKDIPMINAYNTCRKDTLKALNKL